MNEVDLVWQQLLGLPFFFIQPMGRTQLISVGIEPGITDILNYYLRDGVTSLIID